VRNETQPCEQPEWLRYEFSRNWRCTECQDEVTPGEMLVWNEVAKLRAQLEDRFPEPDPVRDPD
jgi:hypothetical protein